jgi:hypothetical protein
VPSPLGGAMHLLKVRHSLHWTAITLSLASQGKALSLTHSCDCDWDSCEGSAVSLASTKGYAERDGESEGNARRGECPCFALTLALEGCCLFPLPR